MRVAKEHIYEPVDQEAGLYRLAIPAGGEVTEEDMKRLGLRKNDARLQDADEG